MQVIITLSDDEHRASRETGFRFDNAFFARFRETSVSQIFGRGHFARLETTDHDLRKMKAALGDRFVIARDKQISPYGFRSR